MYEQVPNEVKTLAMHSIIGWLILMGLAMGQPAVAEPLLQGQVRLASGEPVPAAQVRLFDLTDLRRLAAATTDENGFFALPLEELEEVSALPERFLLGQNYPNPFNPSTIIPYQLPASTHVRLEVFNLLGQRVATLVDEVQSAGFHTARWDATDAAGRAVASGVYLYRLRSEGASSTRRMVVLDGQKGIAASPQARPIRVQRTLEQDAPVYGLAVTGPRVITYIDPGFRIPGNGVQVELVVEGLDRIHRSKTAASGLLGDVNNDGQVDISDALILVIYSLDPNRSITLPNQGDISLGDLNMDGLIDVADALLILTYLTNPLDPTLPAGIGEPVTPTAETPKMYWADGEKIQRADGDGSNVEDVVTSGSPREVVVDVVGGKIYWTDLGRRKIRSAGLDGSNPVDIVSTGLIRPVGIALDKARGKIYWTDSGSNKIQRANTDGSQVENLVSIGLHSPEGLALDAAGGKIYWTDFGTDKIQRANLNGSQVEDLVSTGLRSPAAVALDAAGGKMYWSDFGTDKIQRANLNGSQIEDLVSTGLRIVKGLALDLTERKIYWTDSGTQKIQRANLDGSNVEDVLSSEGGSPLGLAVVSPFASLSPSPLAVPFSRDGSWRTFTLLASEPVIVAVNPSGTTARMLVAQSSGSSKGCPGQTEESITRYPGQNVYLAGCETGEATVELRRASNQAVLRTYTFRVSAASKIYWIDADSRKIQRANLDGSNVEDLVSGLKFPLGIALDVAGGKMYWTDRGTEKIHRSNLDGSTIEDLINSGLKEPRRVALDLTGGMMYWADATTDKIQRATLNGANIEDLVTGLVEPRGLALNVEEGKMYWTDRSANKIQRADLDGSDVEDLVTGLREPVGLALDLVGGKIYWADSTTDRIQRADLDGSNVEDILTIGLGEPRGLALDIAGGKIYWADNGTDRIQCVNLDGSQPLIIRRVVTPIGIALDIPQDGDP